MIKREKGKIKHFSLLIFFMLFFTFNLVFSLAFSQQENNIFEMLIPLAVILTIVLVLLYLGGVLKFQFRTSIDWPLIFYTLLIILVFLLPFLQKIGIIHIFPDNPEEILNRKEFAGFKLYPLPRSLCTIFKNLNISESIACYLPAFIYFFVLPFTAIYVIVWAFLKQLKIFEGLGRSIEGLIAFIISFMTLPMGIFLLLIAFWFSISGAFSIAVFVIMFLGGLFFRGAGFVRKEYSSYKKIVKEMERELKSAREEFVERIRLAAREAGNRIGSAGSASDIIGALNKFFETTGLERDSKKILEIERQAEKNLNNAKEMAEKYIDEIVERALSSK